MPRPLQLSLTSVERAALLGARDHHAKAYLRERAAAIVRVADGWSARAVARSGCRKPRRVETVGRWVAGSPPSAGTGSLGCWCRRDAGASPLFLPPHAAAAAAAARAALVEVLYRAPRLFGRVRSRWWLDGLRQAVDWRRPRARAGVWRLLRRLGRHYKRGRRYVHSPDPDYDRKLARVQAALRLARWNPTRYVVLFADELTSYLRATVAQGSAPAHTAAPRAHQGWGKNRTWRLAGSLNALTGQHHAQQAEHFGRWVLLAYLRQLQAADPQARRIFVVLDNWPVHGHQDLLTALAGSRLRRLPPAACPCRPTRPGPPPKSRSGARPMPSCSTCMTAPPAGRTSRKRSKLGSTS
ncbi:MAG TPA: hypothetical protein VE258_06570 [Ktedonobacterales bacterium]|nr:hypothetical protein [Ktedonobacterales bacterium]